MTSTGACSVSGSTVTMTSGTGICSVTATKAADANYNSATSTAVTVSAALADQAALSVTGVPGVAQAYGTSFIVGTSGGSGTGAVSYDSTGACSVSGNTVTMTSGTGTCSVTATKAADTNYNGTASAAATVAAALRPLTIAPASYSRAVGAANPTLGGTVSGALAADLNVSLFVAYNTTATTSSPAGVYPINVTVTGGAADSYAVTISTATLTVVSAGVELSESALSVPASANAGGQMSVSGTTVNGGDASSPATTTLFYLSTDSTGTAKGVVIGSRSVPVLAGGGSWGATSTLTLPANLNGTYYVFACSDGSNQVAETDESNCVRSDAFTVNGADLTEVVALKAGSTTVAGKDFYATENVKNQAGGKAGITKTLFYLSIHGDNNDINLGYRSVSAVSGNTTSSSADTKLTLPVNLNGTYYLRACSDGYNVVSEQNEDNNCIATGSFTVTGADLKETVSIVTTGDIFSGGSVQISDTV